MFDVIILILMELEIVTDEKNFLEVKFKGDAHSILNILKKKLLEDDSVSFSGYNKPHPLINESILVVKTDKQEARKVLNDAINSVVKDLESLKVK